MTYTQEQKRAMYAAGEYVFPVPPVTAARWTDDDWIRWINGANGWRPVKRGGK